MATHPFDLDQIRIASPCPAKWAAMSGDERVRFCAACKLHVYDLSAMTREAATRLVEGAEGRLCVRFRRRADGTILTADCPLGIRAVGRRLRAVAAAILGWLIPSIGCGCSKEDEEAEGAPLGSMSRSDVDIGVMLERAPQSRPMEDSAPSEPPQKLDINR
jgi:hypothetical protein